MAKNNNMVELKFRQDYDHVLETLILGDANIKKVYLYWEKWGLYQEQKAITITFIFLKQSNMDQTINKNNVILNHLIFLLISENDIYAQLLASWETFMIFLS